MRLMLALAAIAWLAGCTPGPPRGASMRAPAEAAHYADPDDPLFGRYQIRLLRGGTEIEFVGVIGDASAAALETALDEAPQIHVVRLTSPGGSTLPAIALERTIRAKGVITYVPSLCASACAYIFLGGRERYVAPKGQLGFHRGVGLDDSPAETTELAEATRSWMLSRGVTEDFAEHAMSVPESSIWFPTVEELLQAHVITAATSRETFAETSAAERSPELLQSASLSSPVYAAMKRLLLAIKKADPAAYRGMQDDFHQALSSGSYDPEKSRLGSAYLTAAFKRAVAVAADDAVIDFVRGGMQQFLLVSKTDRRTCADFGAPKPDPSEPDAASAPWYRSVRRLAAMTAIFETSVSEPQSPPSPARVRSLLDSVVRDVAHGLAGELQDQGQRELDPRQICAVYEAVIKRALALNPADRSVLLRGVLSGTL